MLSNKLLIFILATTAIIVSFIPIISWPFSWIMTFFHEISHGIAALITGGKINSIQLHFKGSGLCITQGGNRFLIAFSGYMGAILWGVCIYLIANNKKYANYITYSLITLILFTSIFYAKDIVTIGINICIITTLAIFTKLNAKIFSIISIKFIGIYVLLSAIKAPLDLIDGKSYGDAANLAKITFIPEIVWVIIWLLCGILSLVKLYKIKS